MLDDAGDRGLDLVVKPVDLVRRFKEIPVDGALAVVARRAAEAHPVGHADFVACATLARMSGLPPRGCTFPGALSPLRAARRAARRVPA